MTTSSTPLDALVVGAGPAGLTAAIYLARFKRDFLVIHDGQSRAGWIPRTRNHPGFPEGIAGPELLRRIRLQAEQFGTSIDEGLVEKVTKVDDLFRVDLEGRALWARRVLLATGVIDRAPDLPGVEDALRQGILRICPICDGFEVSGQTVAVIGADTAGAGEALFLTTYSDAITLIHTGPPDDLSRRDRERLSHAGIAVIEAPLSSLVFQPDQNTAVCTTAAGTSRSFHAVYSALGVDPRCDLAAGAGAATGDDGRLVVNQHQETTVPGLFAAGDLVRGLNQISTAEGEAAIAATAIHNQLREISQAWPRKQ